MAQKDVVVGIDFGSTSVRARLWCPSTGETFPVQNYHFGQHNSRYTLGDFSSTGYPFDTRGAVYIGEDPDPTRESVSLKYGMYVLSKELDEFFEEYRLVEVLRSRMHDPAFQERLMQGLRQLFSRVFDRIEEVCHERQLRITKIGLSVPSQWKVGTETVYRGIIDSAIKNISAEIFFVTETEALAHFLCRNYLKRLIREPSPVGYDIILFLDFGGHNMNSCIYHVGNNDAGDSTPSFYLMGSAVGAGGGSEQWEYNVTQKAIEFIEVHQRRRGALSVEHKQELRDQFDREKGRHALEHSEWFRFERIRGLDGKLIEINLGPQVITSCFNDAMSKPFEKVEEQIQKLVTFTTAKDAWVVVSGGTAQHKGIRTRLEQLCTEYGTRPPRFIESLEPSEYTVKIAQGTAYAVGHPLTVEQFMDRGAAFGIQTRQCMKHDEVNPWDNTAKFLMTKDKQGTQLSIRVSGLDKLKIICDPFFRPTEHDDSLHYTKCYDLLDLGQPSQGVWYFSMTLEGEGDAMSLVLTRRVMPHKMNQRFPLGEDRLPLRFHKGQNCVLVEGTDMSGFLPGITFTRATESKKKQAWAKKRGRGDDAQSDSELSLALVRGSTPDSQSQSQDRSSSIHTEPETREQHEGSDDAREFQFMKSRHLACSALNIMRGTRTRKPRRFPDMVYDLDESE